MTVMYQCNVHSVYDQYEMDGVSILFYFFICKQ